MDSTIIIESALTACFVTMFLCASFAFGLLIKLRLGDGREAMGKTGVPDHPEYPRIKPPSPWPRVQDNKEPVKSVESMVQPGVTHFSAVAGPKTCELAEEGNEGVILKLPSDSLLRIYSNLTGRMHELGYERLDWDVLDLGFELRPDWPLFGPGPTLAQMVVVAHKLRLRIVIDELHVESFSVNRPPPRRVNPAPEAGKPAVGGKESAVAGGDCECG